MNMKEYAKKIAEIAKKYPDATAVFATDQEGSNSDFFEVELDPTIGIWEGLEFTGEYEDEEDINAVCIN